MKTLCPGLKTVIAALFMVLCVMEAAAAESVPDNMRERPPRILLLSSVNLSFVQYFQEVTSCLNTLNQANSSYLVEHYTPEPSQTLHSPEKLAEIRELLDKIRAGRYQVVVAFYGPMLDLLRHELRDIPQKVKIIVCGLPPSMADRVPKAPNVYPLYQDFSIRKNLNLIRTLFPGRKKVILLSHWNPVGVEIKRLMREEILHFPELELLTPDNNQYTPAEILDYIEQHKKDAVILFFGWFNKYALNAASLHGLMDRLGHNRELPLFVMHSSLLYYGTVGGCMEDGQAYGRHAAMLTRRLLDGEEPHPAGETIPSNIILNQSMLDFYGIPAGEIPAEAVVLDVKQDNQLLAFYRKHAALLFSLFGFMLISICILLFFIIRFKRFARQISDIFHNMPFRVLVVDADEKVLMYHVSAVSDKIKTLGDFMPELYPMLRETLQKVLREKRVCTRQYILNGLHQRGTFVYLPEQIFGRPAMLGVGIDVDELYYLNQNEMVQMKCLQTVLPEFNANASFAAILKIFCEHLHGDRCYLIRYDLQNRSRELVEEYCAPGISALQTNFPAQVPETMDWINRNLTRTKEGHKLEHCRVSELPDSPLARYLHQQEVKDLYTMPIFLKNELWGSFGLVYKQRSGHLSPVQKQLFPMIAKMVELILLRQSYISDIAEARDAALAAAQAKSTFLATMSHELRSPLNAVIGFSELLSDGSLPPQEFREYISGINYAGKSLLALINNILDYSKLESEQMKIVAAPTDFNELLNKLKAVFRLSAEDKGLELNFLCRPLPGLILDAYRVRQILTNLLSNAIKFTEKGQVQVLVSYESGALKIAVSDTGRGVNKDFQRKIFEPFYQQENSDATCIGGTGLGLVISKKLAEQMHGYIQLVSEPGFGSTFTLVLPNVPAVTETADSTPRELPDMTGCRGMDILIVDDSPINLKILEAMFRKIQLPVRKAASGAAALEAMSEKTADVIFTDLRMPEMNGSELARIIRRNPAWNRVRVVAITADIMFNEEQKAVFDAVLLKPISLEQLFTLLYRFSKSA